ncbi:MAG: 4-hydroxythreonine-4-phosphate dehydrogenase PdxA [Deltaproteobacteria bacterium]|nr:4-hydroxythreonine-4-phosphate dehydrogenase PdxA [Deltaproteobacteria bacterium]
MSNFKIKLAISMGDPNGIGPEVILKNLKIATDVSCPVIFGHFITFKEVASIIGTDISEIRLLDSSKDIDTESTDIQFVNTTDYPYPIFENSVQSSLSQFESLKKAVDAIKDGQLEAIATAPVSKDMINRVHKGFSGHTEYLANRCGLKNDDVTMVFATDKLIVGLITTHLPITELPQTITTWRYERTTKHVIEIAAALNSVKRPKIAIAGFNPHAGEDGLLGKEEIDIIIPFCKNFNKETAEISGPIPADAVFRDAFNGKYHAVVSAYHDQALIALKLSGFGGAVNITQGLDFIRTSPDHGTAYDIARKNIADSLPMKNAIITAARLVNHKKQSV